VSAAALLQGRPATSVLAHVSSVPPQPASTERRGGVSRSYPRKKRAETPNRTTQRAAHDSGGGAGAGWDLLRRDRRGGPVPHRHAAVLVGRVDPAAPRVRHHGPAADRSPSRARRWGWAAIEAVQKFPAKAGWLVANRARLAERRGRNIATVAAARKLLTLVYYGLRDGHIGVLERAKTAA